MQKKTYVSPSMKIIALHASESIAASGYNLLYDLSGVNNNKWFVQYTSGGSNCYSIVTGQDISELTDSSDFYGDEQYLLTKVFDYYLKEIGSPAKSSCFTPVA